MFMKMLHLTILVSFLFPLIACGNGDYEQWNGSGVPGNGNGNNQEQVTPSANRWAEFADSCTFVLVENYLDKNTGTFWSSVRDIDHDSDYIYWQQAHAMDVLLYSWRRIKDANPELAGTYKTYFRKWYDNDANNYNNSHDSEGEYGGFYNDWTDDMAWICLTLLRMSDFTGEALYAYC